MLKEATAHDISPAMFVKLEVPKCPIKLMSCQHVISLSPHHVIKLFLFNFSLLQSLSFRFYSEYCLFLFPAAVGAVLPIVTRCGGHWEALVKFTAQAIAIPSACFHF